MTTTAINKISIARYGVPMLDLCPTSALWLAEVVAENATMSGWDVWCRISRARGKIGKGTMFPAFGTRCFCAR